MNHLDILSTIDMIFMLSIIALSSALIPVWVVEQVKEIPTYLRKARIAWDNRRAVRLRVRKSRIV